MAWHAVHTGIGSFTVDSTPGDCRVHIDGVELHTNLGPDSLYRWSLDQEEALFAAAREAQATAELIVPGGFRIAPDSAVPAFLRALARIGAEMTRTDRMTPPQ